MYCKGSNNNRVIVLEGLPGSGKSSLISMLKNDVFVVDELFSIKNKKLPVKNNELFFLENDFDKVAEGRKKDGVVVVDRGYPSTLAHNFSRLLLDGDSDYFQLLERFLKNKIDRRSVPDMYIFLNIDVDVSLKRKSRPFDPGNIWTDKKHLRAIKDYYGFHFKFLEPDIPILNINAQNNLCKIYDIIKNHLVIKQHG